MKNLFQIQKQIKWNISILIILVLLASSLIWLLTMNFLKQMLSYTNENYSYHKSYYFAKAWLELSLVEIDNSWIWFSNILSGWNSLFFDNFDCEYCGFDVNIQWKTKYLSNKFWLSSGCNDDTAFLLKWGESFVLPMFLQKQISSNLEAFSPPEYSFDLLKHRKGLEFIQNQDYGWKVNLWLIILSGNDIQRDYLLIKSYETSIDIFKNYFKEFDKFYWSELLDGAKFLSFLIVSNTDTKDLSFCVHSDNILYWWVPQDIYLPTTNFYISSIWTYLNRSVGLQAIYGQAIPWFLANTYLE